MRWMPAVSRSMGFVMTREKVRLITSIAAAAAAKNSSILS